MKSLEKIFDNNAKKIMIRWDINNFKKEYPHLYKTIILSMKDVAPPRINLGGTYSRWEIRNN